MGIGSTGSDDVGLTQRTSAPKHPTASGTSKADTTLEVRVQGFKISRFRDLGLICNQGLRVDPRVPHTTAAVRVQGFRISGVWD